MQPLKIAILGGGTAGWMAANLLANKWPTDKVQVSLVESPDIGIIGVGEGSTPTLKRFFEMINVAESEWMHRCDATYKVNIQFNGWSPASGISSYSHPFISQVDTFTERAFTVNCRTRRYGLDTHTSPEDFLLCGTLAKQGKGPVAPENFPFTMEYGYHFDSGKLGCFLAEVAKKRGVNHIQTTVESVLCHPSGDIAALVTNDGREIEADFFIDCTGFASILMQKTLKVPFNSFKQNLFNDSAVVIPTPAEDPLPVQTEATALSAGWCWKIPLTARNGNGYVYSSDFITPEQAEAELLQHLNQKGDDVECRHLKMRVGQLSKHWNKNCLAIGLSQGFIEPLEATALHLVQITIELFMAKFAEGNFSNKFTDEFNHKITDRFERVRDYIVAHYKLNSRDDSEYWKANRENNHISGSLSQILDVWYQRGELDKEIQRQNLQSHFGNFSWHCLLSGYGAYPPLAPNQPGRGDLYIDNDIAKFMQGCALNFSSHKDNLDKLKVA